MTFTNTRRYDHETDYPPPHSIRTWLTAASLIAALALLAAPATAQVDWATVFDGEAGQVHCPPGKTHTTSGSFETRPGSVKTGEATVRTNFSLSLANIKAVIPALAARTSIPITIILYQGERQFSGGMIGTVTADNQMPPFTRTFRRLRSNTRHAADLIAGSNDVFATACFRTGETPADLTRPLGHHDDINHGDWASGCYAFADRNGPNHRKKVIACLCGARNRKNEWSRTGTLEPNGQPVDSRQTSDTIYKWTMPASWRSARGCSSS